MSAGTIHSRGVTFQNKGVIDPNAYRLFGASAKEGSNPIGFFGTGLKYAIAIFVRLGCKVQLWRGEDELSEFELGDVQMRGKTFQVVREVRYVGHYRREDAVVSDLPFTTELGKTWAPWQALREMWCNALDEGGEMQAIRLGPRDGYTTIIVTGQAVMDAWHEREKIMITGTPRWLASGVEVFERQNSNFFYRGIRVQELGKKSRYTYNLVGHPLELTEDRTARYSYMAHVFVAHAVMNSDDEDFIRGFLQAPKGMFENEVDLSDTEPGDAFLRVMDDRAFGELTNLSAIRAHAKRRTRPLEPRECSMTALEEQALENAKDMCRALQLPVDNTNVIVTTELPQGVLGQADMTNRRVWIDKRAFAMGGKMVAGTLMEELIHVHKKHQDESRDLQNYLVDLVVTQYEERTGVRL